MARNRRHQSAAIRFGPALKAVALCLVIGGSAVGYVWQKDQIRRLGDRFVKTESELGQLRQQNEKLRMQLNTLQSPRHLELLARQHNTGLIQPAPDQVIRLADPMSHPVNAIDSVGSQYAANSSELTWPH